MAPKIKDAKLCFIGGGNMGAAIIGGLLAQKRTSTANIIVSDPFEGTRQKLESNLSIRTTTSNDEASKDADLLVLAVKPQVAKPVCEDLAKSWNEEKRENFPIVVSICAGIPIETLSKWFGKGVKVVRVMPNTPALLGEGASGAFAGEGVDEGEKRLVGELLEGFSKVGEWVEREELIDVVTALSGSGPAYFFLMVEHMTNSGVALGLPREQAERLAKQTCLGAGKMLVESSEAPRQLRINVTSPKGTTEAALNSFKDSGFDDIVNKAMKAAADRGEELGKASF